MTPDVFGNGTKETWRGTMLNECFRRLPKPRYLRKELRALYLSGPVDRDGPELVKRGLNKSNLLAVDIDISCVEAVRRNGSIGLCAAVQDVLLAQSNSDRLDLVLLDLMGGINTATIDVLKALLLCASLKRSSVIMLNLLAGRDRMSRNFRSGSESPHRGKVAHEIVYMLIGTELLDSGRKDSVYVSLAEREMMRRSMPWFSSYYSVGSSGIRRRYDSVVFNWHGCDVDVPEVRFKSESRTRKIKAVKRKLAAAKAVRTMRIAGTI